MNKDGTTMYVCVWWEAGGGGGGGGGGWGGGGTVFTLRIRTLKLLTILVLKLSRISPFYYLLKL